MQRFNGRAEAQGLVVTSGLNSTNNADLTYALSTVTVNITGGGLATIFSDNAGTPLSNPFTANVDATFSFYAANGRYTITVTGSGVPTITVPDVLLFDPAGSPVNLTGPVTVTKGITADAYITSTRGDRQIILQNPDFEGSSLLPPPGWSLFGTPTLAYETVSPAPGKNQSLKITGTQFQGVAQISAYSVLAGDSYSIQADVKSDTVAQASVVLQFQDKTGAALLNLSILSLSGAWQTLTATGVAPANSVKAVVLVLVNNNVTGTFWVDQISVQKTNFPAGLTVAGGATIAGGGTVTGVLKSDAYNLSTHGDRQSITQNPDFEGSSLIPPPGWSVLSGVVSYETVSPFPGKLQSLKLVGASCAVVSASLFSVVPGDVYSIQAAVKSDGTGIAFFSIQALDKNNGALTNFAFNSSTSAGWTTLTASGVVPANAVSARITLQQQAGTSQSVWFDIISIQKTNFPAPVLVSDGSAAAPTFAFLGQPSTGFWRAGSGAIAFTAAGTNEFQFDTLGAKIGSGGVWGWTGSADPTLAGRNSGISATAPGVLAVGNGTQGDVSGAIQARQFKGSISVSVGVGGTNLGQSEFSGAFVIEDSTTGGSALILHDNVSGLVIAAQVGTIFVLGAPGAGQIGLTTSAGTQVVATASAARNGDTVNAVQLFNH